jgi:hypothetical protein
MTSTPLLHASVAGISGLALHLGPSLYFAPVDDAQLYRVEDQTALAIAAALALEERILDDLPRREISEPTAVLLSDGTTAFYVATGEIV